MKKKILYLLIPVLLLIFVLFVFIIPKNITKNNAESELLSCINSNKLLPYMDNDSVAYLNYLKGFNYDEIEITDAIVYYIKYIENCLLEKYENKKSNVQELVLSDRLDKPTIYCNSLKNSKEFVKDILTDDDYERYLNNVLFDSILNKLKNNLVHKSNDIYEKWYISNSNDIRIELPYNIYFDFKHDKKMYNDVDKILNLNYKKNGEIIEVGYKTKNGENKTMILDVYKDANGNCRLTTFEKLFLSSSNKPSIDFGQHNYDASELQNSNGIDELMQIGDNPTPQMNWEDYDEDGNLIVDETTISNEEALKIVESIMQKENNKQ